MGYGIGNPELISALEKVRLPYNLPSPTQVAAKLALAHRQALLAIIPTLQEQRQILTQTLTEQGQLQLWPSRANFLYGRPLNPTRPMADELEHWFVQLKTTGHPDSPYRRRAAHYRGHTGGKPAHYCPHPGPVSPLNRG